MRPIQAILKSVFSVPYWWNWFARLFGSALGGMSLAELSRQLLQFEWHGILKQVFDYYEIALTAVTTPLMLWLQDFLPEWEILSFGDWFKYYLAIGIVYIAAFLRGNPDVSNIESETSDRQIATALFKVAVEPTLRVVAGIVGATFAIIIMLGVVGAMLLPFPDIALPTNTHAIIALAMWGYVLVHGFLAYFESYRAYRDSESDDEPINWEETQSTFPETFWVTVTAMAFGISQVIATS